MAEDRREDWNNSVEKRLVDLNSAQMTTDIQLSDLEKDMTTHDRILLGDAEHNKEGLDEAVRRLETEINKFNRVFDKDYLGHGGLVSFVTYLYNQEHARDKRSGYKWGFLNTATVTIGAIICALLPVALSVYLNWGNLQERITIRRHTREAASVERTTKKLKAERAKARKARAQKAQKANNESAAEDLPDVQPSDGVHPQ